jgi:hypothetical protein
MAEGQWHSPNEMLEAAKDSMLEGREPSSQEDWYLVLNFFAANIEATVCESACLLIKHLYDIPVDDENIKQIVQFQLERQ